jgi:hypothetical protein
MRIDFVKSYISVFWFCALSFMVTILPGVRAFAQTETSNVENVVTIKGIPKQTAIYVAKKEARRRHLAISRFKIVPCEQVMFWRIIFDGGGPDLLISKQTGKILAVETIPQSWIGTREPIGRFITREQAIAIAKRDAQVTYAKCAMDPENFAVIVCQTNSAWRVIFDFKLDPGPRSKYNLPPNGKSPKYVIDKTSGDVVYRELN